MTRSIILRGEKIFYRVKKSRRARRISVSVNGNGEVGVTIPVSAAENLAVKFMNEKAAWILSKIEFYRRFGRGRLLVRRGDYERRKLCARRLVVARLAEFNKIYNFTYGRVSVKNQKTRWGSCSRRGNLNFNFRILALPPRLSDYVIVHELCHLREFNHSLKFWHLVGKAIPEYPSLKKQLRTYQFDS